MGLILAIEGGGTRSSAGLYRSSGELLAANEGGPCNPVAGGLESTLAELAQLSQPILANHNTELDMVLAGLAGLFNDSWRRGMAAGLCRLFNASRAVAMDDFNPLLAANIESDGGILVIAGTGSKVAGRAPGGRTAQAGGRGVPFGEEGSAYRVAMEALRETAAAMDGIGPATTLVAALPQAAGVEDASEFIAWANHAGKRPLAELARCVDACAASGDAVAREIIESQATRAAAMALAVARRLELPPGTPVLVHGGLIEGSSLYRGVFDAAVREAGYVPRVAACHGHQAVLEAVRREPDAAWMAQVRATETPSLVPPTERRAVAGTTLDRMSAFEIVRAMNEADSAVIVAVARQAERIARLVEAGADAIQHGGRIVYVGAGTSGRLGVLDASECPPTFGVGADRVVALMAGGEQALRTGVEGAEDDRNQGVADIHALDLTGRDLVVGIAASGTTPYVRAALDAAAQLGATTALICCNPAVTEGARHIIALDTGPEILAGSTRLKAGTATKLVLNTLSTGAMALSGYVYDGLMIGMRPVNQKLWQRAIRIVSSIGNVDEARAESLLHETSGHIATAILMARRGMGLEEARRILAETGVRGVATFG